MKYQKFDNEQDTQRIETETQTLNENVSDNFCLYFLLIWSISLINDAGSVMVMTIAHDLAADFGKVHLMPLFQIFEHSFCTVIWFANSRYFIKLKHIHRLIFNSILMLTSHVLMAVFIIKKTEASFYLCLFCSIIYGFTQAFGESTILGLLKGYPSKLVGAFGAGTGTGSVLGSFIFLVFGPFLSSGYVFLIAAPFSIIYAINCMILVNKRSKYVFIDETSTSVHHIGRLDSSSSNTMTHKLDKSGSVQSIQHLSDIGDDSSMNVSMNLTNFMTIMHKSGDTILYFSFMYFLGYSSMISFADIYAIKLKSEYNNGDNFFVDYCYIIFIFCYQIGCFLSRSSLNCFKIQNVSILVVLQLINWTFGFANTYLFFTADYFVMFAWITMSGVLSGLCYSNSFYLIINSGRLEKKEKELATMICGILSSICVFMASIFALTMSNSLFRKA